MYAWRMLRQRNVPFRELHSKSSHILKWCAPEVLIDRPVEPPLENRDCEPVMWWRWTLEHEPPTAIKGCWWYTSRVKDVGEVYCKEVTATRRRWAKKTEGQPPVEEVVSFIVYLQSLKIFSCQRRGWGGGRGRAIVKRGLVSGSERR